MEIRKAEPSNIIEIDKLCNECTMNLNKNGIHQWDNIYPNTDDFKHDISEGALFVAITPDSGIAGCIVLNTYQDKEYNQINWRFTCGKIAVIHRLMVLPEYEGKGIANELLNYTEKYAGQLDFKSIRLDMFSENPRAIAFYKKQGYIKCGVVQFRKGLFVCAEKQLI
jgi:ribosomal protein S18 acetylase RimI-like enzyme